MKTHVEGGRM